jgi:UDP-N-acetylglucosamine 4-epimerase
MEGVLKDKKVLVTGGAGFIGSNLIESLLLTGNYVTCLDNFSTGKLKNLSGFMDNSNFRLIEGDIRSYNDCVKAAEGAEIVFHEAALGSVPRSIKDPVTSTDVNIGGFVKMLHASIEAGVRRFIYAASSSTYGDNQDSPKTEEKIGKALSPYAITKYVDELFAENFTGIYGIETIGLRYFNVFGRRQDPDGAYAAVIPKFIKALLKHEQPVIYGDGTVSRDFTYIDNVILANHLAALASDISGNEVFNIAHGDSTSLNQLFEYLRNIAAKTDRNISEIKPIYEPPRSGDIKFSKASVEKARKYLGYEPSHNVLEGLEATVEWFRKSV